jgi:UDP-N-acetylmuramate dehydrogenase
MSVTQPEKLWGSTLKLISHVLEMAMKRRNKYKDLFEALVVKYPKIIAYPITDDTYKIAAGWLIEACGWKGIQKGTVGCYEKQSLVIVHYNNGPGMEIFNFSEEVIQSVLAKFEIILEREVVIY